MRRLRLSSLSPVEVIFNLDLRFGLFNYLSVILLNVTILRLRRGEHLEPLFRRCLRHIQVNAGSAQIGNVIA